MAVLHENDVILIDSKKISYGKLSANGSPPAKGPRSDNRRALEHGVETLGFEPTTSGLQSPRSPS